MSTGKLLYAGAAEFVITPPVGVPLGGWSVRAAGDGLSRFVRDDLFVRALALARADQAWMYIIADVLSIDPVAVQQIRAGIAAATGLDAFAIMVCATHSHSAPILHPTARQKSIRGNGCPEHNVPAIFSYAVYTDKINAAWRAEFIRQAVAAGIRAWQSLLPAEVAFGEAAAPGVASSRRVRLSDGAWADPRRDRQPGAVEVSRTEPDPAIRLMMVRGHHSHRPIAALINFGCHPWVFSGAGISAELAGTVCRKMAAQLTSSAGAPPIVLFCTGPEGDVTAIWNIDVEQVWKSRPGETAAESLRRREQAFTQELERLGNILARGAMSAIAGNHDWDACPEIDAGRRTILLPLKDRYSTPPEILLADWQKSAPAGRHLTELQIFRAGHGAILALPGEPFSAIGRAIRRNSPFAPLLIAALANDGGEICYVPDRAACAEGGYEIDSFPLAPGAGEIMIEQAINLIGSFRKINKTKMQ